MIIKKKAGACDDQAGVSYFAECNTCTPTSGVIEVIEVLADPDQDGESCAITGECLNGACAGGKNYTWGLTNTQILNFNFFF